MNKDRTLTGLYLSVFLMMISVGMIVSLLPQRIISLDGHGGNVGYLASMFAIAYIAFQIPIGRLADRYGFKPFIVLGYTVCFVTGLAFYFSASSTMVFLSRLLQGAGEAPVWALAPALLSVRYSDRKGAVMGAYNAILHIGLTLGPIAGIFLAKVWQPDSMFLLYALFCLTGAALCQVLIAGGAPGGAAKQDFSLKSLAALCLHGNTLLALGGIMTYGAGYGIFLTNIPGWLIEEKEFGSVWIGVFFALFYVSISITQLVTGRMADKSGPGRLMVSGLLTAAFGLVAVPYSGFAAILALLVVASLGLGVFYLSSMVFLNNTVSESVKGTISGAYYLFWGMGMFIGPPVLSFCASSFGFHAAITGYAFICLLIAILLAFFLRK